VDEQELEKLLDQLDEISIRVDFAIKRVKDLIGQAEVDKWHRAIATHCTEMAQELANAEKP
jgi:hypothetical protein